MLIAVGKNLNNTDTRLKAGSLYLMLTLHKHEMHYLQKSQVQ